MLKNRTEAQHKINEVYGKTIFELDQLVMPPSLAVLRHNKLETIPNACWKIETRNKDRKEQQIEKKQQ